MRILGIISGTAAALTMSACFLHVHQLNPGNQQTSGGGGTPACTNQPGTPVMVFGSLMDTTGAFSDLTAETGFNLWTSPVDASAHTALTTNGAVASSNGYNVPPAYSQPVYSKDGTKIAFASQATFGVYNIWVMNADTTGLTALTQGTFANSYAPTFSPDGTKIAFYSNLDLLDGPLGWDTGGAGGLALSNNIWVASVDGTSVVPLTQNTGIGAEDSANPRFSPDGSTIVFQSVMSLASTGGWDAGALGVSNIWSISSAGGVPTDVTQNTNANSIDPQYSPDGTLIVFASNMDPANVVGPSWSGASPDSSSNIWTVNPTSTALQQLTTNTPAGLDSSNPSYNNDGTKIVFSSLQNTTGAVGSTNIWVMAANGSSPLFLTNNTGPNLNSIYPSFSPDGAWIGFSSQTDLSTAFDGTTESYNVWAMHSDGTVLTALTRNDTTAVYDSFANPAGGAWMVPTVCK